MKTMLHRAGFWGIRAPAASGGPVSPPIPRDLYDLQRNFFARFEDSVRDLEGFFAPAPGPLVTIRWDVNLMDFLMVQRGLHALLPGWRVAREQSYSDREASLVERCAVEVAPGRFEFVTRHGRQYWEGPAQGRFAADLWIDEDDRHQSYSGIRFTIPESSHEWLREFLPRVRQWADQNHFLRGQAFNAKGQFLRAADKVDWSEVYLSPAVRDALSRNCIDLLTHAALYKANGIPLKRGLVLYGPPGTGKTLIGRALAQQTGVTFILATPGMLEESEDVRRVFQWGGRFAPSILFFEDFDLVAGDRHGSGCSKEILGEFLSALDGIDSLEGVITIATTNNLGAIESALKDRPNRIDCLLEIPPMGEPERVAFLNRRREECGGRFDTPHWAARTRRFTGAQLQELCRLATFEAVEERIRSGGDGAERIPLADEHLQRAFAKLKRKPRRQIGFTAETDEE